MHQEHKNFGKALDDEIDTERRLRLIIDTTPALIYRARPDGYIDFFNQHCLECLGLPLEEISGWGWTKTIHADDIEAFLTQWRAAPNSFEPLHYRPNSRNVRSWRCREEENATASLISIPTTATKLTRDREKMTA